jgi:hypothetical protein
MIKTYIAGKPVDPIVEHNRFAYLLEPIFDEMTNIPSWQLEQLVAFASAELQDRHVCSLESLGA